MLMTQDLWHAGAWPQEMLDYARSNLSERKLRLIACAVARTQWGWMPKAGQATVLMTEKYVDGEATMEAMLEARENIAVLVADAHQRDAGSASTFALRLAMATTHEEPWQAANLGIVTSELGAHIKLAKQQQEILREIIGNPFAAPCHVLELLTSNHGIASRLAAGMHHGRCYDELPILGDVLEEHGCTDDAMLSHARSSQPHVRGCWLLDLLMGYE